MGLWQFLQEWRGSRAAAGITASVLLHVLLVTAVLWGSKFPITERWRTKPGDALIVELPKPDESPEPGVPDAPATPPNPAGPPISTPPQQPVMRPGPPTPPTPPAAQREVPAPRRVASALRVPEPAKPAPRSAEPPGQPAPQAPETAERGEQRASTPAESPTPGATPSVERVPPGPRVEPSVPRLASLPPGGSPAPPNVPDMRSALRRGAGGRGQGWAGIEGDPIRLDSTEPGYSDFLEQVRRQIHAKWGYPCLKNPVTFACDYYNARVYVMFGIHKSGRLEVVDVQTSSGYAVYDDYAVTAVRLAAPYPPVPQAMLAKFKTTNVGVPILAQFTYSVETSLGLR